MTSEAQCLARLAQARQALRDGMEGEALAHARQAAEWFPDALVVRMTLGFALSANGLHDAAELVFKQAREHDPAAVRAYCTRLGATPHDPLLLDSRAIHLAHDFARRRACDWRSHDYLQRFADWIDHAPSRASCQPVSNYKGAVSTACKLVFVAGHGTFRGTEQTLKSRASWVVRSPSNRVRKAARIAMISGRIASIGGQACRSTPLRPTSRGAGNPPGDARQIIAPCALRPAVALGRAPRRRQSARA